MARSAAAMASAFAAAAAATASASAAAASPLVQELPFLLPPSTFAALSSSLSRWLFHSAANGRGGCKLLHMLCRATTLVVRASNNWRRIVDEHVIRQRTVVQVSTKNAQADPTSSAAQLHPSRHPAAQPRMLAVQRSEVQSGSRQWRWFRAWSHSRRWPSPVPM
jgi:hypothetical protein